MFSAPSLMLLVAAAAAAPVSPAPVDSAAAAAAARGDLDAVGTLAAANAEEELYLKARLALAHRRIDEAESQLKRLPQDCSRAVELGWRTAHASRDPARLASTARRYCQLGEPTGRACAEAELYSHAVLPTSAEVPRGGLELSLAKEAPFPLMLGTAGRVTMGVIVDTGASQSVISSTLARHLRLRPTQAGFPVGVLGGAGTAQAHMAVIPELKADGLTIRNLPVLVMDLPELDTIGISAILSPQQALDGLVVSINFKDHVLALRHSTPAEAAAAPAEFDVPYLNAGFDLVVQASVGDGPRALFGFDTGMEGGFSLSNAYAGDPAAQGALLLRGAGDEQLLAETAPRTVYLGGAALKPQGVCLRSELRKQDVFQLAGILGNGLWKDRTVTLDTVARRIRISRPQV